MADKKGIDGVLLYKAGGVSGGGDFAPVPTVTDLAYTSELTEADATTRGSGGFAEIVPILTQITVEFEMVYDPEDAAFVAIRDAHEAKTIVGFQILDEADGEGLQANFFIMSFNKTENKDDMQRVAVTMKLGRPNEAEYIGG